MTLNIQGHSVLIDDSDAELVDTYRWHINDKGYAVWRGFVEGKKVTVRMHRLIMGTPDNMDTDHINRNRLDNRRVNLRICDRKTNLNNGARVLNARGYYHNKSEGDWRLNSRPSKRFKTEQGAIDYVKSI